MVSWQTPAERSRLRRHLLKPRRLLFFQGHIVDVFTSWEGATLKNIVPIHIAHTHTHTLPILLQEPGGLSLLVFWDLKRGSWQVPIHQSPLIPLPFFSP